MDFGKMMDDAGKGFDEFATNAGKSFEEAGKGMNEFGENVQKQANEAGKAADELGNNMSHTFSEVVGNALKQAEQLVIKLTKEVSEDAKRALGLAQDTERELPMMALKVSDWASNILPKLLEAAGDLGENIKEQVQKAQDWVSKHPDVVMYIVLGVTGIVILAVPGLLMTPILSGLGFGASGIAAGSMAAAIQSGIGSVAAGSAFAGLTSAAMGGLEGTAIAAVGQAIGAAMTAGGAAGAASKLMNNE